MGISEWFDPETESLLSDFRVLRDRVLGGDTTASESLRDLADKLRGRSTELHYLVGRELSQLVRNRKMRDLQ